MPRNAENCREAPTGAASTANTAMRYLRHLRIDKIEGDQAVPSVSKAQARLMQAVANNSKFAKKVNIPQSVGREFYEADRTKRKGRNDIARTLISRNLRR
jgi:hypothetical protein